jgi:hypothetical protein
MNTETLNPEPVQMIMPDPYANKPDVLFVVDESGSIQEKYIDGVLYCLEAEDIACIFNIDEKEVQRTSEAYTIPDEYPTPDMTPNDIDDVIIEECSDEEAENSEKDSSELPTFEELFKERADEVLKTKSATEKAAESSSTQFTDSGVPKKELPRISSVWLKKMNERYAGYFEDGLCPRPEDANFYTPEERVEMGWYKKIPLSPVQTRITQFSNR